jgi:hypothetical protein
VEPRRSPPGRQRSGTRRAAPRPAPRSAARSRGCR